MNSKYIYFIILIVKVLSIQYVKKDVRTDLSLDGGYFYIKSEEYLSYFDIYLYFYSTNYDFSTTIEICYSSYQPTSDSIPYNCTLLRTLTPDKTSSGSNEKRYQYSFKNDNKYIIIYYSGSNKSSNSKLQVKSSGDSIFEPIIEGILSVFAQIILIIFGGTFIMIILIVIIVVLCLCSRKKKVEGKVLSEPYIINSNYNNYNYPLNPPTPFIATPIQTNEGFPACAPANNNIN